MIMLVWLMVISIYNHENENYGSWIHMDTIDKHYGYYGASIELKGKQLCNRADDPRVW